MDNANQLEKNLSLRAAIGLAITMVIGSGLLVLPGLAYAQVGASAFYAWAISAIAVGPILIIFATLGGKYPNAGGIAGFMQTVFGRSGGIATEILVFGAVPGGAAIAITGGQYFSAIFDGTARSLLIGTLLVLLIGSVVNCLGARLSGLVQQYLAFLLVALLIFIAVISFSFHSGSSTIAPLQAWPSSIPAFGLVFFAFVGWEMMAFTSEEFKNPKRDFPLMIGISYAIVVVLYLLIAFAIQSVFPPDDPRLSQAPMAAMLSQTLGPISAKAVAGIGYVLVLANFISVVWAFSRLTFSSAREGLLPKMLAQTTDAGNIPIRAILVVACAFGLFVLSYFQNLISHNLLFELAGVSFFFSYLLAIIVYLKQADSMLQKGIGGASLCLTFGLFFSFGVKTLYPIALFLAGWILSKNRLRPPFGS